MKKLIFLFLSIPLLFSSCTKDDTTEPEPAYYRTYIMESDYLMVNTYVYKYVPNLTGSVEYKKNSLTLRILENGKLYYSKTYSITENYDKKWDSTFLFEGTKVIGTFTQKGHSGATSDQISINLDNIRTLVGYTASFEADFY